MAGAAALLGTGCAHAAAVRAAGSWGRAITVPGLGALNKGRNADVLAVSCPSPGSCAAVGDYRDGGRRQQGFVAVEKNGRWRQAVEVPGLGEKTVTCPAGVTVPIRASGHKRHAGAARFGPACRTCPLAAQCTTARQGRTITLGHHEARLAAARQAQADPAWKADYKATRPKVERKIGHLMRRRHGGRRARVRGQLKVAADFALLAAAANLARLAVLGVSGNSRSWAAARA